MKFLEFIISHKEEILDQTSQHLFLTLVSMAIATIVGVAIGVIITRIEKASSITLGFVGAIQTIPSLALLGFLLPIFGIGTTPAIIALFLYALLPIVRNTYTGIKGIDPAVKEASKGMGMTKFQLLYLVEFPLAFPIILAGIRTSTVINVGVATLCALIAAGGLGEFIFRGISLNNTNMILAGAIPASILAILLDATLGILQRNAASTKAWVISGALLMVIFSVPWIFQSDKETYKLTAGFTSEFIEREDGYLGLDSLYDLPIEIKEMEIALKYQALNEQLVDVIDGFSTDGKIREFNLTPLKDDKRYFPPYFAVPLVNSAALQQYPELVECFKFLENKMSDEIMSDLNHQVDGLKRPLNEVANEFLKSINIYANPSAGNNDDAAIQIGSKAFTENFLLAYIFAQLIENKTDLTTNLKLGFGGTKLVYDALRYGDIDLYPEYTGTAYLVLLQKTPKESADFSNPDTILNEIKYAFINHNIEVLPSLGFNNTFALMMRKKQADSLAISSISELSKYLNNEIQ